MKKTLSILLLLVASLSAVTAQTEKGRWTVGASVGSLSYNSQPDSRSFSGSFSPSVGYFVANNLVVGTGLPVSFGSTLSKKVDYSASNNSIGLSPFVRYYFGATSLKPYVGLSYAYSRTRQRIDNDFSGNSQHATYKGFSSSISPTVGLAYFINRTVALNAGVSYVVSQYNNGTVFYISGVPVESATSRSNYLAFGIGFQLFFGK
jgi:outer membrane protein W